MLSTEISIYAHEILTFIDLAFGLLLLGFPGGSVGKESACNAEDPGSIPGLGRFPGEGSGSPLQYSCLGNAMDRGAWQATSMWSQESDTA